MICPKCNFQNQEATAFCTNCGNSLTPQATPSQTQAPQINSVPEESSPNLWLMVLIGFLLGGGLLGAVLFYFIWKSGWPKGKKTKVSIIYVLVLYLLSFLFVGLLTLGIFKSVPKSAWEKNSNQLPTQTTQTQETGFGTRNIPVSSPQSAPTPTPAQVIKQINTLEEAMSYALTGSGMQFADTAKVREIDLLYTPTYKNWTFKFTSRTNQHKSEKTFATVYDEVWTTVKIKNTGEVNLDTSMTLKDQAEEGGWLYLAKPAEAAISSYLDLAKQKLSGAGLSPGQIISATFDSMGLKDDTQGYNNRWKIAVVLAGEESNTQKKAKTVVFMGGNFKEMYDSNVTIY